MHKYTKKILTILGMIIAAMVGAEDNSEKPFVVIEIGYNNKEYVQKNLESLFGQKYDKYRFIYVDDASTDGTGRLVQEYIQANGKKATFIQNKERAGVLDNLYRIITQLNNKDIVILVESDDWLAHDGVLAYLNKVYANPNVWLTYGQFAGAAEIPVDVIEKNSLRSANLSTHAITFYAGLFQRIKKDDLLIFGQFTPIVWNTAIVLPMLEMAGKHSKFIPDVLYVYNKGSPLKMENRNRDLQNNFEQRIRSKDKYEPLASFE